MTKEQIKKYTRPHGMNYNKTKRPTQYQTQRQAQIEPLRVRHPDAGWDCLEIATTRVLEELEYKVKCEECGKENHGFSGGYGVPYGLKGHSIIIKKYVGELDGKTLTVVLECAGHKMVEGKEVKCLHQGIFKLENNPFMFFKGLHTRENRNELLGKWPGMMPTR